MFSVSAGNGWVSSHEACGAGLPGSRILVLGTRFRRKLSRGGFDEVLSDENRGVIAGAWIGGCGGSTATEVSRVPEPWKYL
jgi:hypothetical protein